MLQNLDSSSVNDLDFRSIDDKLPPQNIEAEEAILGGILLDPEALDRVINILSPEAFYIIAHRHIYSAALALHSQNKPTDLLTVTSWLTDNGLLAIVGGRNKLATLVDRTVSAVNIDGLAQIVAEKYLSRKMISSANLILALGFDQSKPVKERLDAAEQAIFALRLQNPLDNEPQMLGAISQEVYDEIEALKNGKEQSNIPCGFYDLDAMLGGGFQGGQLAVVAGRTSMGKSTFGHQLAFNISVGHQAPTMIFSLEMSKHNISQRFIASESGIRMVYLKSGKVTDNQWPLLVSTVDSFDRVPMLIDHSSCPTVMEIRSRVRKAIKEYGQLKLVVIDYLQLMAISGDNQLVQQIGEITRQLKLLARECDVPIILLSQLNRGVEGRTNKRPMLSDLRDSGRIEEDADLVLGLYRDEYYNPESPDRGVAEVIILKNRNGETGTLKLLFHPELTKFKNLIR